MSNASLVSNAEITRVPGISRHITTTFNQLPTKKVMYASKITNNALLVEVMNLLEQIIHYNGLNYSNRPYTQILDSTEITNSITSVACPGFTSNYVKDYVDEDNTLSIYVLTNDTSPIFIVGTTITNKCNCIHISTLCSNKDRGVVDRFKPLIPGKKMMRTLQLVTMILGLPCIVLESLPGAEDFYLKTGFFYLASNRNNDGTTTITLTDNHENNDIIINHEGIPIMIWLNPDYERDTFTTDCTDSDVTTEFINFYLDNLADEAFVDVRQGTLDNLKEDLFLSTIDDETYGDPTLSQSRQSSINSQDSLGLPIGSPMGSPQHSFDYDLGMGSPQHSFDYDLGMGSPPQEYPDNYSSFNMGMGLSRQSSIMEEKPYTDRKSKYKPPIDPDKGTKERREDTINTRKNKRTSNIYKIRVTGLGGKSKRRARRAKIRTRRARRNSKKSKKRY
jgi:hypothetical protein